MRVLFVYMNEEVATDILQWKLDDQDVVFLIGVKYAVREMGNLWRLLALHYRMYGGF